MSLLKNYFQLAFILSFLGSSCSFGQVHLQEIGLQDAEEIAIENNKQYLIAVESTKQAKERKSQSISRFLPSIHYTAIFQGAQENELFFNIYNPLQPFTPSHKGYSSSLQIDQPVFSSDLIFNFKSKEFEYQAIEYQKANTLNELLLGVRRNYFLVVYLENALTIERENISYLSYALEQEQKRLNAGSSTTLEVNQSKASVANAISLYYATLKELKNARNSLVLTLGINPLLEPTILIKDKKIAVDKIPELSLKLQQLDQKYHYLSQEIPSTQDFLRHIDEIGNATNLIAFSGKEVSEYLEKALSYRPDLRQSQMEIEVSEQNLRAKQGKYLPEVEGFARYSYNDGYLGPTPYGPEKYYWTGGLVLKWNLFDSLLRESEIKEARSKRQSYRINFDKVYQKVEVEIRNSLYQLEESMLAYLSSTQAAFVSEQARFQAAEKLKFGKIPPLDYRDSANQLFQAKNQQNKASFDLVNSYYELRYATGVDATNQSGTQKQTVSKTTPYKNKKR